MVAVRRKMNASMKTHRYRISYLFWLMTTVAGSAGLGSINSQWMFLIVALWISIATAFICQGPLRMGFRGTSILCLLVLDLCGASLVAFGSWVVHSNPSVYPNSISLGDPATSFVIGFIAFTPVATVFSLASAGIGFLVLNQSRKVIIDEQSDAHQALGQPF